MTIGFYTKWIIGGILLLVIIAGACYLWYQHDMAPYKQEAAETAEVAREWEAARKAEASSKVEQAANQASVEGNAQTAEKPINKISAEVKNNTEAERKQQVSDMSSENATKSDEKVSPHGFGPYPKVPQGYPGGDDPNFWEYPRTEKHELMTRVRIKLWEQGIRTQGSSFENGLVYPVYPNTLIVKWKTQWTPFGTRKRASSISGSPETESFLRNNPGPIYENDIPSDIKVIEYKDAGIDPYTFLDLQ